MKLGACTKSFGGKNLLETAKIFSRAGLDCAELCFCQSDLFGWKYNFSGYEPLPELKNVLYAKEVFAEQGIEISSVGIYNCLWQGGGGTMAESLKYFCEYCDLARDAGIKLISTHTGTLNLWSNRGERTQSFPENVYESITYAVTEAEKRGLTVSFECTPSDAVTDYGDFLRLKKYTEEATGRSNTVKYTAMPGFCKNTDAYNDAAMFHIRDKKRDGKYYESYGKGDMEYGEFFGYISGDDARAVILEYVDERTVGEAAQRIKKDFLKGTSKNSSHES